jgi:hypothetical protein
MEELRYATFGIFEEAEASRVDSITQEEILGLDELTKDKWNSIEDVSEDMFGVPKIAEILLRNVDPINDESTQLSIDASALAYITKHEELTEDMIVEPYWRVVRIAGMPWTNMKENTWDHVDKVMTALLPPGLWFMVNHPRLKLTLNPAQTAAGGLASTILLGS